MDWSALTPAIFSLLGVALGRASSVLATYYPQRTSREQQRMQVAAALRDERKEIVLEYMQAVQNSWRFLDGLWGRRPMVAVDGKPLPEDLVEQEAAQRTQELWYHQQKLALVTSARVHESALRLTERIHNAVYDRESITTGLWQHLNPAQREFMEAASAELNEVATSRL